MEELEDQSNVVFVGYLQESVGKEKRRGGGGFRNPSLPRPITYVHKHSPSYGCAFLGRYLSGSIICSREQLWMIYRGPGFLVVLWFGSSPNRATPFPLSPQQARPAIHRNTEKERQLAVGRGGGGWGAETYDRTKAWSSINHSIFFGLWYHAKLLLDRRLKVYSSHLNWDAWLGSFHPQ